MCVFFDFSFFFLLERFFSCFCSFLFLLAFLFIFFFFTKGLLHSGRSKVTRHQSFRVCKVFLATPEDRNKSWRMSAEGFRDQVTTDGSLLGVPGRWRACGWAETTLRHRMIG